MVEIIYKCPESGLVIAEINKDWKVIKYCCDDMSSFPESVELLKGVVAETKSSKIITSYFKNTLGVKKTASGWLFECDDHGSCVDVCYDLSLRYDTMLKRLLKKHGKDKILVKK